MARVRTENRMEKYAISSTYTKEDGTKSVRSKTRYYYVSKHHRRNQRRKLIKAGRLPKGRQNES